MAIENHIRNPIEWAIDLFKHDEHDTSRAQEEVHHDTHPPVRRVSVADLKECLALGAKDFGANRSDVVMLCIIYPIAGLILARAASGYELLPLVFPLASGFALLGPLIAVGLYEISRRQELGDKVNWTAAFGVLRAPGFWSIVGLGVVLLAIFAAWIGAAYVIYWATLGPEPPASVGSFLSDVFTTGAGWAMIILGCGVGFVFAVVSLTVSVVSFPLLLDRNIGVYAAVETSVRAVRANPRTMAVWGLIVSGSLVAGSIPALVGLIVVLPLLGHATWHLYKKVVPR